MSLSHWNPFREMEVLLSRFPRDYRSNLFAINDPESLPPCTWAPAVDISETDKEYLIRAELSGMKKEDVKITVNNGVLSVSGERRVEKTDKDEKHHRVERSYGSFTRSFALPEDAAAERVSAECRDGVLTIHLAKNEVPKPRSIEVKVN